MLQEQLPEARIDNNLLSKVLTASPSVMLNILVCAMMWMLNQMHTEGIAAIRETATRERESDKASIRLAIERTNKLEDTMEKLVQSHNAIANKMDQLIQLQRQK